MVTLPTAKRLIVAGGCLSMAYQQLTLSPATVEYFRYLGATGLEFGLLGALPTALVVAQLLAGLAMERIASRKQVWFWLSLVQRMLCVPVALGPWLFPGISDHTWVVVFLAVTFVNHFLMQFTSPLWLSWMGDYLPRKGMNAFWGSRQYWNQSAAAVSLFAGAVFFLKTGVEVRTAFVVLIVAGAVMGVIDILLFIPIPEPKIERLSDGQPAAGRLWRGMTGPFRDPPFRTFIAFSSYWHVAAMIGAPFISLYLLQHVGLDLYHVLQLWTISWVGGAIMSRRLGLFADQYGHRPLLFFCTVFKSGLMLMLLSVPQGPSAFGMLIPIFMVDALLNTGITIANNGYMLKNSPPAERTMYIAAGQAYAGIAGGVASVVSGLLIGRVDPFTLPILGWTFVDFHVLFATSLVLRLIAIPLALRVREPGSRSIRATIRGESTRLVRGLSIARRRWSRRATPLMGLAPRSVPVKSA